MEPLHMFGPCHGNYLVCYQPNGERIRIERWVYEAYIHRVLCDPFRTNPIRSAVKIYSGY